MATARRPPLGRRAPRPNQENIAPPPPSLGPAEAPTVPSGDSEVGGGGGGGGGKGREGRPSHPNGRGDSGAETSEIE